MKTDPVFWDLVLRHRDVIVEECRRACGDRRDQISDTVSEVMLALHRGRRNVMASQRHGAYIRTVARHVAHRWLRREARREMLPLEVAA